MEQAYKLSLLGLTDLEMITFFNVSERAWNNWKKKYPEFMQSLRDGKAIADADVSISLYKRATGYEHDDVHISNYQGEITKTELVKHYPPDPTSMIFWLKNRQRGRWKDRIDNTHSDPDGGPVKLETNFTVEFIKCKQKEK